MSISDPMSANELLQKVGEVAAERRLAALTKRAYERTWSKLVAWSVAHDLDLSCLPDERVEAFYRSITGDRSASHHQQVKAALSFFYKVARWPNPFSRCIAPKFSVDKLEIRYLTAPQLGLLFTHLANRKRTYFDRLAYHLAHALFYTACRFHEWALLDNERLLRTAEGTIHAVRLKTKGGKFRDLPIPAHLAQSLAEWIRFVEAVKGERLLKGAVRFAGCSLVFPGRDGTPITNPAFNSHLSKACKAIGVPIITAHGLRHTAATMLLNSGQANLREVQDLLGHKTIATTSRYTHVSIERLRNLVAALVPLDSTSSDSR